MKKSNSPPPGLIYIFTGEGKGKTSAALGVALRSFASGLSVAWVAWYKQSGWGISEFNLPQILNSHRFQIFALGKGFHIPSKKATHLDQNLKAAPLASGAKALDTASEAEHQQAAKAALKKAHSLINQVDLLILDEVNNALHDGLINLQDLKHLLEKRGSTHLILTGRDAHAEIIKAADLVTDMKKVKHPYDQGKLAVKGLDF